jgi:ATP-dependent DNA ligase
LIFARSEFSITLKTTSPAGVPARCDGESVFACKFALEGIVSKRIGSPYRSGRSRDWIKSKNPAAPAVKREAEEDWGR